MDESNELQEILEEFFTEADEGLDELEQDLIKLETMSESGERDSDLIDRIFRVMHTLKGGAGFLGLEHLSKLAHAGENLLDEIRSGKVEVSKEVMDALLQTNDELKALLDASRSGQDPGEIDVSDLLKELESLAKGESSLSNPKEDIQESPEEKVDTTESSVGMEEPTPSEGSDLLSEIQNDPRLDGSLDKEEAEEISVESSQESSQEFVAINDDLLAEIKGDPRLDQSLDKDTKDELESEKSKENSFVVNEELLAEIQSDDRLDESLDKEETSTPEVSEEEKSATPTESFVVNEELLAEIQSDDRLDESLDKEGVNEEEKAVTATPVPNKSKENMELKRGQTPPERREDTDRRQGSTDRRKQPRRATETADATIRVETSKLDKTMNLVGELVLARNSLTNQFGQGEFQRCVQAYEGFANIMANMEHLSRVTRDLQMSVLSTRMQPIKKVFDKIPRQVRELKNKLDKEVDLMIEGEMTEVDKTLVEELADPMVHLIRNALDHGIETPAVRAEFGKSSEGTLSVRAFYEGNKVVIQIADDGKGVNPDIIRKKAIEKGLVDEDSAYSMSDEDAVRLIMAPGFSTAEEISDVSGRGVGMDVVNSRIQAIKGTVDIESEVGMGTTISIYLPLTLAIVQALIVESNNEGFAVPIGDISEVIKFKAESIHKVNDQDVIELRGEVLPLYYLSKMTKLGGIPQYARKIEEKNLPQEGADEEVESVDVSRANLMEKVSEAEQGYVIVVKEGSGSVGVVTDRLIGQEEAVVKPITEMFSYNPAISGATISGDGIVHMILDVPYLMKEIGQKK